LFPEPYIGTILFTAADVSVDRFLERLPVISEMAQQVVITTSDADHALSSANIVMGGKDRIGTKKAEAREEDTTIGTGILGRVVILFFSFVLTCWLKIVD